MDTYVFPLLADGQPLEKLIQEFCRFFNEVTRNLPAAVTEVQLLRDGSYKPVLHSTSVDVTIKDEEPFGPQCDVKPEMEEVNETAVTTLP